MCRGGSRTAPTHYTPSQWAFAATAKRPGHPQEGWPGLVSLAGKLMLANKPGYSGGVRCGGAFFSDLVCLEEAEPFWEGLELRAAGLVVLEGWLRLLTAG
jgi:hypothetical protein